MLWVFHHSPGGAQASLWSLITAHINYGCPLVSRNKPTAGGWAPPCWTGGCPPAMRRPFYEEDEKLQGPAEEAGSTDSGEMKGKAEGEVERKREKGSRRGWRERNTQTEPTREKEKGIGEPGCQQEADQDRKRTAKGTEKTHVEVLGERCHHSPLCLSLCSSLHQVCSPDPVCLHFRPRSRLGVARARVCPPG